VFRFVPLLFICANDTPWTLPRLTVELGDRTAIMGILNVTPDSFSDGGQYFDRDRAIARGKEMEQESAEILDVGGESTRPGSKPVSEEEETERVLPVIEALAGVLKIPISVDTYRAQVARRSLGAGAQIVNDTSAMRFDPEMAPLVKQTGAGVVLMHRLRVWMTAAPFRRTGQASQHHEPPRANVRPLSSSGRRGESTGLFAL